MAEYTYGGDSDDEQAAAARPRSKRPTKAYVEALAAWVGGTLTSVAGGSAVAASTVSPVPAAGGFWGQFWMAVAEDLRFLRGEYQAYVAGNERAPNFPDGFDIILAPTPADKARQSIDQIFIGDPTFTVELPHGIHSDSKRAELEQRFTKACYGWHNTEERNSDTSPLKDIKHNTIALGLGVRSTVINRSKYPEKPERRKGEKRAAWEARLEAWKRERRTAGSSCFAVRSIHPLNIAYDRQHSPPEWMLIREGIDGWNAAQEYPNWKGAENYDLPPSPSESTPLLTMARYWSPEWTGCWIAGDPALGPEDGANEDGIAPNPYGFIPVWPAAGGHGHQDPSSRPEWELQGMVRGSRGLFVREGVIDNLKDVYMRRATWGPQDVITGPEDDQVLRRLRSELTAGPGTVVHMPQGYSHTGIDPSPIPDVVLEVERKNDALIDRATIYDVSAGAGTPTEPAARTRVRLQQVDKKLADASLHIEQAVEADYTSRFMMIKHVLKAPVGVNVPQKGLPAEYVEIDPEDIPDGLVVKVRLVGESEEEKARKQQMLDQRLNAPKPTIDLLTYLKEIGEPDPEGVLRGMVMDALRPLTVQAAMQVAMGQLPMMLAGVAEEAGIRYTPEELATASMRAQVQEVVNASAAEGTAEAEGGGGGQNGRAAQVNQQGAALPGTAYENAESGVSDNPQVSRPDSGEALQQRLRLSGRMNGA